MSALAVPCHTMPYLTCSTCCRYEIERNCQAAVTFVDEQTLEVSGQHGPKQYVFDAIFTEKHGQEAIFADMKNLVQSAVDGCAPLCGYGFLKYHRLLVVSIEF